MRAAVLREIGAPLRLEDVELDEPRAGEILVRIEAAGVCHSDLHYMTGDLQAKLPSLWAMRVRASSRPSVRGPVTACRSVTGWPCSGGPAAASARRAWRATRSSAASAGCSR